jgi:putative thiamine transport system ATP-binding protein
VALNTLVLDAVQIRLYDHLHGRVLLGPLSASVAPGQVLAVMGSSGSGKSSLLAWCAGLLQPPLQAEGRLLLDGQDVSALPTEQRHIGLLFQDDLLFPHWTVLQNLLFALPPGPRAQRVAAAEAALLEAELAGLGGRRPDELSGGQRARVSLQRALLARPRALLLDEPFSKLDAALRERMRNFTWHALAQRGVPALLVTHDVQDVPHGAAVVHLAAHV